MAALDKALRLQALADAQAKAESEKAARLEPKFPYKKKAFDAKFFGLK